MSVEDWARIRQTTGSNRRPPTFPSEIIATFAEGWDSSGPIPAGNISLTIEITNDANDLAKWFTDEWWTRAIYHLGTRYVTVQVAPTPGALLQPVLLYQLEMLRRVAPQWRLTALAYAKEVEGESATAQLAASPYHEVRFMDQPQGSRVQAGVSSEEVEVPKLLGRLREAQSRIGATIPVFVRVPSPSVDEPSAPDESRQYDVIELAATDSEDQPEQRPETPVSTPSS